MVGAVEAGEISATPSLLATLCATGIVLPEDSAPTMPETPSIAVSFFRVDAGLGLGLGVADGEFDLAAEQAAGGVDLVDRHSDTV